MKVKFHGYRFVQSTGERIRKRTPSTSTFLCPEVTKYTLTPETSDYYAFPY